MFYLTLSDANQALNADQAGRVAADKALISQVKVLPYQLPDSDT